MSRLNQHLQYHARLQWAWFRQRAMEHPALFRQIAFLHADDQAPLSRSLQPWQLEDLAALDEGWLQLAGRTGTGRPPVAEFVRTPTAADATPEQQSTSQEQATPTPPNSHESGYHQAPNSHEFGYQQTPNSHEFDDAQRPNSQSFNGVESPPTFVRRAYIERARGHSKTFDMAIQIAWILLAAKQPLRGMVAAADRDQARLIHEAVHRLARQNPQLLRHLHFVENEVRNTRTGSTLEVLSSDVGSSWGALPDFVICDELCHWSHPELWQSLISAAAKQPDCLVIVLSNAGIGNSWQWQIREHARLSPHWHFSSLPGPQAPWIDDEQLAEQRALLPPAVYARLWCNQWQHSDGQFVSIDEAQACRDESLQPRCRGEHGREYFAAVDYAEKHDLTVGCVVHQEQDRIVVDRMDVVQPLPGRPTPVRWVEDWIESIAERFVNTRFVLDEHQLVGTIQKLENWHQIRRFDFAGGIGNHRLAVRLRQLLLQRELAWYAGCGAVSTPDTRRDDLETELASLVLRHSGNGRLRIDHPAGGEHHDDRAFALGAACLHLSEQTGSAPNLFIITAPNEGGFAWSGFS